MSRILLEEHAAWCEIAMLCEGPLDAGGGWLAPGWNAGRYPADGICTMVDDGPWSAGTRLAMLDRMARPELPPRTSVWLWPHTRRGWDARSAFAWRMAAECEAEMNREGKP